QQNDHHQPHQRWPDGGRAVRRAHHCQRRWHSEDDHALPAGERVTDLPAHHPALATVTKIAPIWKIGQSDRHTRDEAQPVSSLLFYATSCLGYNLCASREFSTHNNHTLTKH